ncbi:MAG: hypothetical protein KUG77_07455, partial [Nannocystaceae bacterium]|nr:hypothetical protein [Nannocystaceae bacterium]
RELTAAVALPAPPTRAGPRALAAIDTKLAGDARAKAQALLAPLLHAFPNDPAVLWRAALAEGKRGRYSQRRADLVLQTVQLEPKRIEDTEVQEFIMRELDRSVVPDTLLDVLLEYGEPMREDWTRALLGSRRTALPYSQRERLLVALTELVEPLETWDPLEHRCLDLWQAVATDRPCTVYADTLDAMEATPSASYRRTVSSAEIPVAGGDETALACAGLEGRRKAVLDALVNAPGDPEFVPRGYAAREKASRRKSKKRFRFRNFFP